jgi:hypothetical protein
MLANHHRAKHHRIGYLFVLALLVGVLLPVATPHTAYAQDEEFGYYWKLDFAFETSFDALLTIEVGPWEDGEMTEITDTSTATVRCKPVGNVKLDGGDAVFADGGYLDCSMDLAQIVLKNHDLQIPAVDNYGSIYAAAKLMSAAPTIVPIFTHQDAKYSIEFLNTQSATLHQALSNQAGPQQAAYPGTTINAWHTVEMQYICIFGGGPCDANYKVDGAGQSIPTAGVRTTFATGPASFQIGTDGTNFFTGRMGHLVVDPGNSAH